MESMQDLTKPISKHDLYRIQYWFSQLTNNQKRYVLGSLLHHCREKTENFYDYERALHIIGIMTNTPVQYMQGEGFCQLGFRGQTFHTSSTEEMNEREHAAHKAIESFIVAHDIPVYKVSFVQKYLGKWKYKKLSPRGIIEKSKSLGTSTVYGILYTLFKTTPDTVDINELLKDKNRNFSFSVAANILTSQLFNKNLLIH